MRLCTVDAQAGWGCYPSGESGMKMAEATEFEKELRRLRDADRDRRASDRAASLRDAAALQAVRAPTVPLTAEQRRMLNHARVELGEKLAELMIHWRALGGAVRLELGPIPAEHAAKAIPAPAEYA